MKNTQKKKISRSYHLLRKTCLRMTVLMRSKQFVSANFDNYFLPGGGDFDNFFSKMSKSPPYVPPPLRLDIDRCISQDHAVVWL